MSGAVPEVGKDLGRVFDERDEYFNIRYGVDLK
jgi:hypothetical protein